MEKECFIDGCHNKATCKGLCTMHYTRIRRHGNADIKLRDYHHRDETEKKLAKTYSAMKERCYNKKHPKYCDYGGRGITVCQRWLGSDGLHNFAIDMGDKPDYSKTKNGRPFYSLDRIDVDGPYSPENCRWATDFEQKNNKRNNVLVSRGDEIHTISEWSRITGIHESTIRFRIKKFGCNDGRVLS